MKQYLKNKFLDIFLWVYKMLDKKYPSVAMGNMCTNGKYTSHFSQSHGGAFIIRMFGYSVSYEHWNGAEYMVVKRGRRIINLIDIA